MIFGIYIAAVYPILTYDFTEWEQVLGKYYNKTKLNGIQRIRYYCGSAVLSSKYYCIFFLWLR